MKFHGWRGYLNEDCISNKMDTFSSMTGTMETLPYQLSKRRSRYICNVQYYQECLKWHASGCDRLYLNGTSLGILRFLAA